MRWGILVAVGLLAAVAACLPVLRRSAAASQQGTLALFNGRDLTGWKLRGDKAKSKWIVGRCELDDKNPAALKLMPIPPPSADGPGAGMLINLGGGVDLISEKVFRDCAVEVEFMIPKGSNSGIYLMGQYEVQILDSFGKLNDKVGPGDMGGIYNTAAPKMNGSKKPGDWQKFVIDFMAPRFQDGKKVANGKFVKVLLNNQLIHENVEVTRPTGSELKAGAEVPEGPLMIQGDHGPIAVRSVKVTPK